MKTIQQVKDLLKQNSLLLLLVLLMIAVGWRLPQIYWSFVDDGEMIEVSQRMNSSIELLLNGQVFEWLKDPQVGRFRPMYWVYHYIVYLIFGLNRFGHGLLHLILLWSITILSYFTAKKITGNRLSGFLAGTFFVANTLNQENWYRLGPQETPMVFFFSMAVYFFISFMFVSVDVRDLNISLSELNTRGIKKKLIDVVHELLGLKKVIRFYTKKEAIFFILALTFSIFGYLTKENSVIFIVFPALLFTWLIFTDEGKTKTLTTKVLLYLIFNLVIAVLTRYAAIRNYKAGSYASEYIFSFANITSNFNYYILNIWYTFGPVIVVVLLYTFIKLRVYITERKFPGPVILSGIMLIIFSSFLIIQLPWRYAVDRYLLPSFYFFAIFIGIVLSNVLNVIKSEKNGFLIYSGLVKVKGILYWGIWFLIVTVIIYNLATMNLYINRIYNLSNNFNRALIAYLAENVGKDGRVILDTPVGTAIELKQEIGLHLRLFWQRQDVKVEYFENAGGLNSNDILLRAGELKQVSKDSELTGLTPENKNRIDIHIDNKLYYSPMTFIKKYLPHLASTLFTGKIFSFSPILATSADDYYWEIYNINRLR